MNPDGTTRDTLTHARDADAPTTAHVPASSGGGLHIRCPYCHGSIDLRPDAPLVDIECPSCGSSFRLIDDAASTANAATVTRLGQFELIERLGMGAFGTVWKARDTELDRTVAVKIPRKTDLDAKEQEKFIREARAAAQLRHPNIVAVHEVGREGESFYLVSDFVRGVSLSAILQQKRLDRRAAVDLVIKLATGLHHAHEAGVVHRDLKPANIMIDEAGEPRIMDFGLAKRETGEITMTFEGDILGTPAYMSPEQARGHGHRVDRRADIYSLGVILFELLTGTLPFRGTKEMLLHNVLTEDAPSPRRIDRRIPRDLETVCLKCLEKSPQRRYQTSLEVADELRRYSAGEAIRARPIGRLSKAWKWTNRNRTLAVLSAIVVMALAVGLGAAIWQAEERRELLYVADMNNALSAWDDANVGRVEALLRRNTPYWWQRDLRGFEWYYIWNLCERKWNATIIDELDCVPQSLAFSPEVANPLLAVAQINGVIRFFERNGDDATRQEIATAPNWTVHCAFSHDGRYFAYTDNDQQAGSYRIRIQPMAGDGLEPITLEGHTSSIGQIVFSPADSRIATCETSGAVRLWDVVSGKEIGVLEPESRGPVAFSTDGHSLAFHAGKGKIAFWDVGNGRRLETDNELVLAGRVNAIRFSLNGDQLLAGSEGAEFAVWSTEDWRVLYHDDRSHADAVRSVAYSPTDRVFATGSRDGTIKLWDADTFELLETLRGHSGIVNSMSFSPDGQTLASAAQDYAVILWDARVHGSPRVSPTTTSIIRTIAPHHQFGLLRVLDSEGKTWRFKSSGELVGHENDEVGKARAIATSPTGLQATLYDDGVVVIAPDGSFRFPLDTSYADGAGLDPDKDTLRFSPSGTMLAVGVNYRTVVVWDMLKKENLWAPTASPQASKHSELREPGHVSAVAFSPDEKYLAAGGNYADSEITVWEIDSRTIVAELIGHKDEILSLAFSPDGKTLASGSFDNSIGIWDFHRKELDIFLREHTAAVHEVFFSADGTRLVSAGGDGTVRLWDMRTRQQCAVLRGHASAVESAAWLNGENTLASGGRDRTLRFWPAATEEQVRQSGWYDR